VLLATGYAAGSLDEAGAIAPDPVRVLAPEGTALLAAAETWIRRATGGSTAGPSARTRAQVAFDAARGRLVVYGGSSQYGVLYGADDSDVWELDGATWRDATPPVWAPTPGRLADAPTAYDAARGRVVVFARDGHTWEWDGSAWEDRTPAGASPDPRRHAAAAYDADRRVVVLFGGDTCTGGSCSVAPVLGDTWEWDGTAWSRVATGGPPARCRAAAAYAPARGRVVLFGGQTVTSTDFPAAAQMLGDLWEWNGSTWAQLTQLGTVPKARTLPGFACGPSSCLLFGGLDPTDPNGFSTGLLQDTYTLAGATWTRVATTGALPTGRYEPGLVYDPGRGRFVMATGFTSAYRLAADLWEWDGSAWVDRSPSPAPSPRDRPGMAYDPVRRRVVVFGDSGQADGRHVWEWDGGRWYDFAPVDPSWPSTRSGPALVWDGTNNRVLMFGGTSYRNDLWSWNGATATWTNHVAQGAVLGSATQPAGRSDAGAAWDPVNHQLVIFGGQGAQGRKADTWVWSSGATMSEVTPASSPPGRDHPGLAWFPVTQRVTLFGGSDLGDTWEWNGASTTWTQRQVPGPPARTEATLAHDPVRGKLVLFGGGSFGAGVDYADLWEWDGSYWTSRTGSRPVTAMSHHNLVWDTVRNRGVLFGGTASIGRQAIAGEVWELDADASRRPAVVFDAAAGEAGIDPAQVASVRVRYRAGGSFTPYAPASIGAALEAWLSSGPGGAWSVQHHDPEGVSLGGAGAWRTWVAPGTGIQAIHGRDGHVTVRLVPDGTSGAGDATVAADAVEVRVRYVSPP
jgi:hypothetical protein